MNPKYEIPTNEERLAKEFEKLGRQFFDKVDAKNFSHAYKIRKKRRFMIKIKSSSK